MVAPARLGAGFARLGGAVRAAASVTRRAGAGVGWYTTTLLGDHDYARYVAHLARTHPDIEPDSVRAYWRSRHDDSTPQARCC